MPLALMLFHLYYIVVHKLHEHRQNLNRSMYTKLTEIKLLKIISIGARKWTIINENKDWNKVLAIINLLKYFIPVIFSLNNLWPPSETYQTLVTRVI